MGSRAARIKITSFYLYGHSSIEAQSERRESPELSSMRKRRICLLLVAKLAPFGFWSGHGTRASGKIFAIIRSVHPWKLPHLASASLLTAASEVLSISSSSPAPSALSDVRLYHTALGDTIAKHAWSLCPYQSALMLQRSGVGDPSCVALPLLAVLLAPLLAAQRERDSHPRSGKIFFLPAQMNRGGPRIPLLSFDVHQLL